MRRRGRKSQPVEEEEDDELLQIEEEEEAAPKKSRLAPRTASGAKSKKKPAKAAEADEAAGEGTKRRGRPKGSSTGPKKKKKAAKGDDDDDEDEEGAVGRPASAGAKNFERLPQAEQKVLVAEVVRLLLMKHHNRAKVTGADVSKYVLRERYAGMRVGQELLKRASAELEAVFGLQLVQEEKMFFLRNMIKLDDAVEALGLPPLDPLEGLAAVIIGLLHTSKTGKMEEQELFETLSALDFREDVDHKVFGKWKEVIIKKLATEQRYLTRKKQKDQSGDTMYFFSVGPRAKMAFDLRSTEAIVSEVYGRAVNPDKIKELEMERGAVPVPESAKRTPATRGKKKAADSAAAKRKTASRSKFVDEDEEEEEAELFDDDE